MGFVCIKALFFGGAAVGVWKNVIFSPRRRGKFRFLQQAKDKYIISLEGRKQTATYSAHLLEEVKKWLPLTL
jgi:hypothetical protein